MSQVATTSVSWPFNTKSIWWFVQNEGVYCRYFCARVLKLWDMKSSTSVRIFINADILQIPTSSLATKVVSCCSWWLVGSSFFFVQAVHGVHLSLRVLLWRMLPVRATALRSTHSRGRITVYLLRLSADTSGYAWTLCCSLAVSICCVYVVCSLMYNEQRRFAKKTCLFLQLLQLLQSWILDDFSSLARQPVWRKYWE